MRAVRFRSAIAAALVLGVAMVALLAFGGGDDARAGGRVGLSTHLNGGPEPIRPQLARFRAAGIQWVREDFVWARIEREPGQFDWRETDALMGAAAAEETNVLAILTYAPGWASGDSSGDTFRPPLDPDRYAAFARAVVERYGHGGAFWRGRNKERPLAAVELWNEPWGYFFWKPDPDPAAYARLARAGATAARKADEDVEVVVPADLIQVRSDGEIRPWFDAVLSVDPDLPDVVDAWSVHPYPSPRDKGPADRGGDSRFDFDRVPETRAIARRHDADRPIWLTEIGWSTATGADETVTEEEQARHVAGALDRAGGEWRESVARTFIYTWDRSSQDSADREGGYGLRRPDGSTKPAWQAVADAAKE